jgi:hypothetical protein
MGIQNYTTTVNNTNIPQNPLSSPQSILAYNMRSRGATHNQLSNCIANNPYVFYRSETTPTGLGVNAAGANGPADFASDIPASLSSFMIFNNYEKIDEEIDVGNGISLNSAGSMLAVKFSEDINTNASAAKAKAIIGDVGSTYTMYLLMKYGKALVFADGTVQVRG